MGQGLKRAKAAAKATRKPAVKPASAAPKQPPIPPKLEGKPILYAKAGGPPANWRDLRVVAVATGKELRDVIEANAFDGWVVQRVRDGAGKLTAGERRVVVKVRIEPRP